MSAAVRTPSRHEVVRDDDRGATLILALIFLIAVSLVAVSLVTFAGNNLVASMKFTGGMSMQSAANSVATVAIDMNRDNFYGTDATKHTISSLYASPPVQCWPVGDVTQPSTFTITINKVSYNLAAWCSTVWNPSSAPNSRILTISVCDSSLTAVSCSRTPLLLAQVTYNDFDTANGSTCNKPGTLSGPGVTCGTGLSVLGWAFNPQPPLISSVSAPVINNALCPASPHELITIGGSNLSNPNPVTFIEDPTSNLAFPVTSYVSATSTQIQLCAPYNGSTVQRASYSPALPPLPATVAVTTPVATTYSGTQITY
jgi:hypothetical protein